MKIIDENKNDLLAKIYNDNIHYGLISNFLKFFKLKFYLKVWSTPLLLVLLVKKSNTVFYTNNSLLVRGIYIIFQRSIGLLKLRFTILLSIFKFKK